MTNMQRWCNAVRTLHFERCYQLCIFYVTIIERFNYCWTVAWLITNWTTSYFLFVFGPTQSITNKLLPIWLKNCVRVSLETCNDVVRLLCEPYIVVTAVSEIVGTRVAVCATHCVLPRVGCWNVFNMSGLYVLHKVAERESRERRVNFWAVECEPGYKSEENKIRYNLFIDQVPLLKFQRIY